jgi:hypothetical protein
MFASLLTETTQIISHFTINLKTEKFKFFSVVQEFSKNETKI